MWWRIEAAFSLSALIRTVLSKRFLNKEQESEYELEDEIYLFFSQEASFTAILGLDFK